MFNRLICVITLISLSLLTACQSPQEAQIRFDNNADFGSIKTFAWVTDQPLAFHRLDKATIAPELEEKLKTYTRAVLINKGLTFIENPELADIAVSFSVGSRIIKVPTLDRYPPAISGEDLYESGLNDRLRAYNMIDKTYLEGQICVDFHSISRKQTLWHGTVPDIRLTSEELFDESLLELILDKILAEFPPKTKFTP